MISVNQEDLYSIIGTCRLLGVNPEAYLLWVLPKLAAATNKTANDLLPHDFARSSTYWITRAHHSTLAHNAECFVRWRKKGPTRRGNLCEIVAA